MNITIRLKKKNVVLEPLINFFKVLFLMFALTSFSLNILSKIILLLFKVTFVNSKVTFKAFIKPFEAPQRSVKIKI